MGFLPNIFKIPKGDLIPNIVTLGGYGLAKGSIKEAIKHGVPAVQSLASIVRKQQSPYAQPDQRLTYLQPAFDTSYQQPYYSGGMQSWDSSMTFPTFSEVPPVYQGQDFSREPLGFSTDQWPEGFSR